MLTEFDCLDPGVASLDEIQLLSILLIGVLFWLQNESPADPTLLHPGALFSISPSTMLQDDGDIGEHGDRIIFGMLLVLLKLKGSTFFFFGVLKSTDS